MSMIEDAKAELQREIAALRAALADREEALLRAGRSNLQLGRIIEQVREHVAEAERIVEHFAQESGVAMPRTVRIDDLLTALDGAPDPRRITTAEELDALPIRSVVIEPRGHVWIRHSDKWHCSCDGCSVEWTSAEVLGDHLGATDRPLTVLWTPEEER